MKKHFARTTLQKVKHSTSAVAKALHRLSLAAGCRSSVSCLGFLTLVTGLILPGAAPAASRSVSGCQILQDRASIICKAKISCQDSQTAIDAIKPLLEQCAAGQEPPRQDALHRLSQFKSDLYFQCCIGNAYAAELNNRPKD